MSPYRLLHVRGPLLMAHQIDPRGAIYSAVAGFLAWVFGQHNATLLVIAFAAMVGDITSGALRSTAVPTEAFNPKRLRRGAMLKMLEVHIVLLGAIIDWTLLTAIPDTGLLIKQWMPFTRLALLVLIATEASSIQRNLKAVISVPHAFGKALDALKKGDALAAVHAVDESLAPTTADRRWTDKLVTGEGVTPPPPRASRTRKKAEGE